MKLSIYILSAFAGMILHVATSTSIGAVAADESSEMERIINGRDAAEGQFPWSVALFRDGGFICTASIISPSSVLTAAHCVVSFGVTLSARRFHGIANVKKSSRTVRIDFASITPHPQYDQNGYKNDIAVFRTTKPIQFSDTVQPICIATDNSIPKDNEEAIAMGWGDTERFRVVPFIPDNLKYVEQKVINSLLCRIYYLGSQVEDYKICAGDTFSGICNGDSGGPLVLQNGDTDNEPLQIGVASYGSAVTGCGFITPSVWTRVSSFNSFIRRVSAGDQICEK